MTKLSCWIDIRYSPFLAVPAVLPARLQSDELCKDPSQAAA